MQEDQRRLALTRFHEVNTQTVDIAPAAFDLGHPSTSVIITDVVRLGRFISFWLFPCLSVLLLFILSTSRSPVRFGVLLLQIATGILIWTLMEYLLHRFVFHWTPRSPKAREIMLSLHLRHHRNPREPKDILVRPFFSLPLSALFFGVFWGVWGFPAAVGLQIGIWIGFLYYELVHYRIHMSKVSNGLLQTQRRGHFYHHFVDGRRRFGVTSPLWDLVLGTYATLPQKTTRT